MNIFRLTIFGIIGTLLSACSDKPTLEELKLFSATEIFPSDTYLDTVSNKRALIVVAHDDDDCAMSGTIASLTAKGWAIKKLCLQENINPETGINPTLTICQGNELILKDGKYRIGLDTMKTPYLPITYEEIDKQFLTKKVKESLTKKINDFNPSVLFTLDNVKGGYGHPEHIFISQLVVDLFENNEINAKKIYQSVYTNHMEKEIVDKWLMVRMKKWGFPNTSTIANNLYGIDGMPEADVQINIIPYSITKMRYLRGYGEYVKRSLRKFIPYYEYFEAEEYFGIFDREFFRVLGEKV